MRICELCKKENAIILHHKDGNNKNDTLINLEGLCQKCHMLRHKNLNRNKPKNNNRIKKSEIKAIPLIPPLTIVYDIFPVKKRYFQFAAKKIDKRSKFDKFLIKKNPLPENLLNSIMGNEVRNY